MRWAATACREKTADAAEQLIRDAHAVEAAGAFAVVLEAVPRELAAHITRELRIPTIGSEPDRSATGRFWCCTMPSGLLLRRCRNFARRYANVGEMISRTVREYCDDVERECFLRMPSLIMRRERRKKKKEAPVTRTAIGKNRFLRRQDDAARDARAV